jgi:hypothetical protein
MAGADGPPPRVGRRVQLARAATAIVLTIVIVMIVVALARLT